MGVPFFELVPFSGLRLTISLPVIGALDWFGLLVSIGGWGGVGGFPFTQFPLLVGLPSDSLSLYA